jgi:predicted nucleic-acid-binding Zn-ribbon protein
MDLARRKLLGFYNNYESTPQVLTLSCKTYVAVRCLKCVYMQTHKNKIMLFLMIEEKY